MTSPTLRTAAAIASTTLLALVTGCAAGNPAAPVAAQADLAGIVHGGQSPITGATVAVYVTTPAGTTAAGAYGATITSPYSTTTDATGSFRIPSGSYTCPTGSSAYLVSVGGNPGLSYTPPATAPNNSAIFLVAALGPCGFPASTVVVINEVTTVAAAYALNGFAPAGGAGMTVGGVNGTGSIPGFTTSTANAQGLTDAFANANNIVNFGNGTANTTTAGGNGTVPAATINTLADILQDCVNSALPTSTACTNLFKAATPPSGVAPVNVLQAAIDIANYPAQNPSGLFGLVSAQSAFLPTLAGAPNDFSIGVVYTSSQLASPLGLGIDKNDNVYVSGSTSASLIEFNGQGTLLSPTGGWTPTLVSSKDNVREFAFDPTGSLWLSDGIGTGGQGVYQYQPAGPAKSPTQGTLIAEPYSTATTNYNNYAITTDASGNIFGTSYKKATCSGTTVASTSGCLLYELEVGASTPYTATSSFSGAPVASPGLGGARSIFYDAVRNNIWYTDIAEGDVSFLTVTPNASGAVSVAKAVQTVNLSSAAQAAAASGFGAVAVAVDGGGNGYVVLTGSGTSTVPASLYSVSPTSGAATNFCTQAANTANCAALISPAFDVIDGNGNVFIANTGTGTTNSSIVEFAPAVNGTTVGTTTYSGFVSGPLGIAPGATVTSGALTGNSLYQPADVSVDRSGALWTASTGSGTTNAANLVQILGIAAPTNPQTYAGQYGVKP